MGIPDFIKNGSCEVKIAYLEELTCEDGSVYSKGAYLRFTIIRGSILVAGRRAEKYSIKSKISEELVDFIHRKGKPTSIGMKRLSWKAIKNLIKSDSE